MSSIRYGLVPATAGTLALLASTSWADVSVPRFEPANRESLKLHGAPSTFGSLTINQASIISDGTASLAKFYQELLNSQEELGKEFAEAIFDDVWTLYAR